MTTTHMKVQVKKQSNGAESKRQFNVRFVNTKGHLLFVSAWCHPHFLLSPWVNFPFLIHMFW